MADRTDASCPNCAGQPDATRANVSPGASAYDLAARVDASTRFTTDTIAGVRGALQSIGVLPGQAPVQRPMAPPATSYAAPRPALAQPSPVQSRRAISGAFFLSDATIDFSQAIVSPTFAAIFSRTLGDLAIVTGAVLGQDKPGTKSFVQDDPCAEKKRDLDSRKMMLQEQYQLCQEAAREVSQRASELEQVLNEIRAEALAEAIMTPMLLPFGSTLAVVHGTALGGEAIWNAGAWHRANFSLRNAIENQHYQDRAFEAARRSYQDAMRAYMECRPKHK